MDFAAFNLLYKKRYFEACSMSGTEAHHSWLGLHRMIDIFIIMSTPTGAEMLTAERYRKHVFIKVVETRPRPIGPPNIPVLLQPSLFVGVMLAYLLVLVLVGGILLFNRMC